MALWSYCRLTPKLKIFCCDTYGKPFLKALTNRLKDEGLIANFHISVAKFVGPCNQKLDRQIKALHFQTFFNAFLVFADADGKSQGQIKRTIVSHFSDISGVKFEVVVFKYEIEDWICESKGTCVQGNKSSETLRKSEQYEKYRLPNYATTLDIDKLCNDCESFKQFISFLQMIVEDNSNN